ncbi:hypothetical protein V2J09_020954 [Rumex salicifolius]
MGEEDRRQLLLSGLAKKESQNPGIRSYSSFIVHEDDIPPITGVGVFFREFWVESKKLWYLAAPAIFTTLCQYSLGAVTQLFAGHVGTIAIAAVSVENNVIAGFSMGFMIFAYAFNFPITKFLQSQSRILVMAGIAFVALVLHTVFSWLLMLKLGWGLVGAAVVLNASWWFVVVAQMGYVFAGTCGRAWSGFSFTAFQNLWGFLRLSFASAIMIWLVYLYSFNPAIILLFTLHTLFTLIGNTD